MQPYRHFSLASYIFAYYAAEVTDEELRRAVDAAELMRFVALQTPVEKLPHALGSRFLLSAHPSVRISRRGMVSRTGRPYRSANARPAASASGQATASG